MSAARHRDVTVPGVGDRSRRRSLAGMNDAQLKRITLHLLAVTMGFATYWLVLVPTLHIGH